MDARVFDEDVTLEELYEMNKRGIEVEINNGKITKARLYIKNGTFEGLKDMGVKL